MNKNKLMKVVAFLTLFLMVFQLNLGGLIENDYSSKAYDSLITSVNAAADYTWNNTIPVKYPSPANNNGKLVLFDNSHGSTAGQADWVIDGGFSDFADDLVAHGYTVKEYRGIDKNGDGVIRYYDDRQPGNVALNEAVITYDGIKDADVFVIAEANRPFTISERAALMQFVNSGKGIYFIADHYNADRNKNTWDSTEVYNGYNRSTSSTYNMGGAYGDLRNPQNANSGWLAQNFGIRFRFNAINYTSGLTGIKSSSYSEGITAGVQPILMAAGSTLAIVDGTKAKGIVYFGANDKPTKWGSAVDSGIYFGGENEGPYVAISKPSAGKAAFIGDSSPIEDITPKYKNEETGASKSTHDGYVSAGNAALLSVNIVNWLATPESYVGFDGVNHAKGINTPIPMADVEKNITKPEPWATPSYDPWDTSTFAYGSYNAPQGPTSGGGSGGGVLTVAQAIAKQDNTLNTVKGYIVGQPTAANTVVTSSFPSDYALALADNPGETNTAKMIYVQIPTSYRSTFGMKSNPGSMGNQIKVTGYLTPYFSPHSGIKNVTAMEKLAGQTNVTGVTLNKTAISLNAGSTHTLTATVLPADATDKTVTWSSSNTTVASVVNGVVTAKAPGTAVITATTQDGGKTATCNVTVTDGTVGDGALTVAQAIAKQDNTLNTVKGYIVGQPTAANTVVTSSFPSDYALALADNPGETNTTKMIYVQIPTSYRSAFGMKSNPGSMGNQIKVTGYLTPYFSPHSGIKNVTAMETIAQ